MARVDTAGSTQKRRATSGHGAAPDPSGSLQPGGRRQLPSAPPSASCGTAAFLKKPDLRVRHRQRTPLWANGAEAGVVSRTPSVLVASDSLEQRGRARLGRDVLRPPTASRVRMDLPTDRYRHPELRPSPSNGKAVRGRNCTSRNATTGRRRTGRKRTNSWAMLRSPKLRNPLSSIGQRRLSFLREDQGPGEHRTWANEVLDRQVKHLARLIDDLLDVSRLDAWKKSNCKT